MKQTHWDRRDKKRDKYRMITHSRTGGFTRSEWYNRKHKKDNIDPSAPFSVQRDQFIFTF